MNYYPFTWLIFSEATPYTNKWTRIFNQRLPFKCMHILNINTSAEGVTSSEMKKELLDFIKQNFFSFHSLRVILSQNGIREIYTTTTTNFTISHFCDFWVTNWSFGRLTTSTFIFFLFSPYSSYPLKPSPSRFKNVDSFKLGKILRVRWTYI